MAHDLRVQAQVWAMLMTGDTPRYVSAKTGVPLTTVRRWRPKAMAYMRECLQGSERGREIIEMGKRLRSSKMALKKEMGID